VVDVDNFQIRKDLLEAMIEERLLLEQADRLDLRHQDDFRHRSATLHIDVLLDEYRDAVADTLKSAQVLNEELVAFVESMKEKVAARHLYAPTKEKAHALYDRLMNGETFVELAEDSFKDIRFATTGGYLGYFDWESMELAWSNAAKKLKPGEIKVHLDPIHQFGVSFGFNFGTRHNRQNNLDLSYINRYFAF
jgi:parvulin-like peptidyl-prolyl isomerase